MAKYVVLRISGRQFLVTEGEEFLVDRLSDPKKVEAEVLLFVDGDKVKVGKPVLTDVKVKIKVLEEEVKGDKVRVFKFHAKSRYRKHTGFRSQNTKLLVEKIG